MAKFKSIWGDIDVGKVTPAPEPSGNPPADPAPAEPANPKPDVADPVEPNPTEPAAVIVKKKEDPEPDPAPADPNAEPVDLEYSEEDIEKAYNLLIDQGVLPEPGEDDDFDVSPEGIADAAAAAIRKSVADELSATPDSVQQFYSHVINGGDPAAFEYKGEILWSEVNMESEKNQEAALLQLYVNQGMTQEDAEEEVADVKAAGKLAKKSAIAQDALIKKQTEIHAARDEAKAKQQKENEAKVQAEIDEINKFIDDSDEIAGFKLDDKKRKAFKSYLFTAKARTGKTQMQENMASEDRRMRIAFLDFIDYNKEDLEKEVTSSLTKKRKKRLARFSDKGVRSTNSSKTVKTDVNSKKGKVKFPTIFGTSSIEVED